MQGWSVMILVLVMGIIMQLAEQYLPPFLARKVKHATSGAVALLLPQQPTPIWVVALVAVTCVLVIVNESSGEKVLDDRSQTAPPLYGRGAGPMIQTGWWTHPDIGVCLFATSLVLCLLLQLPLTVLAPMLFADPAAAIAGRFYQTHYNRQPEETFRHPDATKSSKTQSSPYTGNPQNYIPPLRQSSSKSLAGSLTFFAVATIAIYYLWEFTDWYLAAYISMVLTMVEALSTKGLDNIAIPLVSCLACYFHRARPTFL